MDPNDRERIRQWIEAWREAGPVMERLRRAEIESADTRKAVEQLFGDTLPDAPPRLTSGLVEQQAWFARLRK